MNKYEDEIMKLIRELEAFNGSKYGLELSTKQCHEIVKCIKVLDKALDIACDILEEGYGEEYASFECFPYFEKWVKIPHCLFNDEWRDFILNEVEE